MSVEDKRENVPLCPQAVNPNRNTAQEPGDSAKTNLKLNGTRCKQLKIIQRENWYL